MSAYFNPKINNKHKYLTPVKNLVPETEKNAKKMNAFFATQPKVLLSLTKHLKS